MKLIDTGLGQHMVRYAPSEDIAPSITGHASRYIWYALEDRASKPLESGPTLGWETHGADHETN